MKKGAETICSYLILLAVTAISCVFLMQYAGMIALTNGYQSNLITLALGVLGAINAAVMVWNIVFRRYDRGAQRDAGTEWKQEKRVPKQIAFELACYLAVMTASCIVVLELLAQSGWIVFADEAAYAMARTICLTAEVAVWNVWLVRMRLRSNQGDQGTT